MAITARKLKKALAAALILAAGPNVALFAADTGTTNQFKARIHINKISARVGPRVSQPVGFGYFNPLVSRQYNPYPYYNIVGGLPYGPIYAFKLPDQNESPFNPPMALSRHRVTVTHARSGTAQLAP